MENLNTYIPTKEFYDSRQNPITSITDLNNREYDSWINKNNDSAFVIEVRGATSISAAVQGCVNMTDPNGDRLAPQQRQYSALKIINLTTLDMVDKIAANGLYQICSAGIPEIKLSITAIAGNAIIVGAGGNQLWLQT